MEKLFYRFPDAVDADSLLRNTTELTRLKLGQTWESMPAAANHAAGLLHQAGIPQLEILCFPADGKTVSQDKRMPLAWETSVRKLTLLASFEMFSFSLSPFNPGVAAC